MLRSVRREANLSVESLEERWVPAGPPQTGFDFGDLPAPYPVTLAENGARHAAVGPTLGFSRDTETDGAHSDSADADQADDGVSFFTPLIQGQSAFVGVTASGAAKLDAWIDFNGDGDFSTPANRSPPLCR